MKMFNVNNDDVVAYTNKLEQMHRSDFPIAVRGTLNDLAFHQKQKELILAADQVFILRNPNFFKSHSLVKKADGFDVDNMKAVMGINPKGLRAAEQLEEQETGGTIPNRDLIYVDPARGGTKKNRVRRSNYVNNTGYVQGRPNRRRGKKSNIVAMAVVAKNTKKLIKIETRSSEHFFKVRSVRFFGRGMSRRVNLRMTPIASYEKGRTVKLTKERPFMEISGTNTLAQANRIFIENAERRFEKALK